MTPWDNVDVRANAFNPSRHAGTGGWVDRRAVLVSGGLAIATVLASVPGRAGAASDVFSAEAYTKLESDGLVASALSLMDGIGAVMIAAGGAAWTWQKPNTELALDVVQLQFKAASQGAWLSELQRARFDPGPAGSSSEFIARDAKPTGLRPVAVFREGVLTLVSVPEFAKWVV